MLELQNIKKKYGNKNILNGLNLHINEGDFIVIFGESGCGKTTLLNILAHFDTQYSGKYLYNAEIFATQKKINHFHARDVGFVFQNYRLINDYTVLENLCLKNYFMKCDFTTKAIKSLEEFCLLDKKDQLASTLSGGEAQRVAIIRSILHDPKIIIADEPTGNLDCDNSKFVLDSLTLLNKRGMTVIIVSHDREISIYGSQCYELKNGRLYVV